jgi:hypothetical protein
MVAADSLEICTGAGVLLDVKSSAYMWPSLPLYISIPAGCERLAPVKKSMLPRSDCLFPA